MKVKRFGSEIGRQVALGAAAAWLAVSAASAQKMPATAEERPSLSSQTDQTAPPETRAVTYALGIDGMSCPFCAYGVEKRLSAVPGVTKLDTDIVAGQVIVTMARGAVLDEDTARRAVAEAGFDLRSFQPFFPPGAQDEADVAP